MRRYELELNDTSYYDSTRVCSGRDACRLVLIAIRSDFGLACSNEAATLDAFANQMA